MLRNYSLYCKQYEILESDDISDYVYDKGVDMNTSLSMHEILSAIDHCHNMLLKRKDRKMYNVISLVMLCQTKQKICSDCKICYKSLNDYITLFLGLVREELQ